MLRELSKPQTRTRSPAPFAARPQVSGVDGGPRRGELRRLAARLGELDRSKMASRGATCRGTAAPPTPPRPQPAPLRWPHAWGRAPDPNPAPPRPPGRGNVRACAGFPGRPAPHSRALPPTSRCSGPRPSAAFTGPPRPTRPRRLRPRAPRPSRSLSFSEGQQLDFTGIGRGCRRRLWLVLRPSSSGFLLSRLLAISSSRVSSFPGFPPPRRILA